MGRVSSFALGFEFCLLALFTNHNVFAAGGTEVGNGAVAKFVSYDEVSEAPLHWMCFARVQDGSNVKSYASEYFYRRNEAENNVFDRCSADHQGSADECVFAGCTYSVM
jgi:hypothetical protein